MRGLTSNGEATEFFTGVQGEGSTGGDPRRWRDGTARSAVQGSPEHDREVEARSTGMKETFSTGNSQAKRDHEEEIKQLQAKVGELVIERDFLAKAFDH